jgi:hypothetical protein
MIKYLSLFVFFGLLALAQPVQAKEQKTRYLKDNGYVLVHEGAGGPCAYTIETQIPKLEAICYFEGSEIAREGDSVIARNTEGCEVRLTFSGDMVKVKYNNFNPEVCDVCGRGMTLEGQYKKSP